MRSDVAVTHGRVIGKREVDTVDKAAVETSCLIPEATVSNHEVEGETEKADLDYMRADGAKDTNQHTEAVFDS